MKIILTQDIDKLGKKYDIKDVADGYARNFLIPKKMAKLALAQNVKAMENEKQSKEVKAEQALEAVEAIVASVDGLEIVIPVKIGEKNELFQSITAKKISDALKKKEIDIKPSQIELKNPIKELGEFPVKIKFDHNLEAEIKVIITEE